MYSTVIESICSLTEHYLRTMVNESRKDEDNVSKRRDTNEWQTHSVTQRTIASMNVSFILDNVVPRVSSQLNVSFNEQ